MANFIERAVIVTRGEELEVPIGELRSSSELGVVSSSISSFRQAESNGIRVVGIAPGLVETPLTRKELENPAMRELFLGVIPMKRPVDAKEIAAAAVFLASDSARSINGHTIVIDAGSLTRGYPALLTGLKKQEPEVVQAGTHS